MGSCLRMSLSWWSACPAVAGSLGAKAGAYNPSTQMEDLNFKVTLAASSSGPFWDTGGGGRREGGDTWRDTRATEALQWGSQWAAVCKQRREVSGSHPCQNLDLGFPASSAEGKWFSVVRRPGYGLLFWQP